jgi:hypothetical protein
MKKAPARGQGFCRDSGPLNYLSWVETLEKDRRFRGQQKGPGDPAGALVVVSKGQVT